MLKRDALPRLPEAINIDVRVLTHSVPNESDRGIIVLYPSMR
jgi:hypothetical protein